MTRTQLENIYRVNGLTDYKLKTTKDLIKVHRIDYKAVKGYEGLDDLNKAIYEKFILNIFNTWGLDSRALLIPKGIYWVEDSDYLAKENEDQDYYNVAGGIVYSIDRNGKKTVLREWQDEDYKHLKRIIEEPKTYLRFEYQHGTHDEGEPRNEWLHVIKDGKEWY